MSQTSYDDLPPLSDPNPTRMRRGPLAWMARNTVAANLILLVLLIGGLITIPKIKQEVFPEFDLDIVTVSLPYPGASPAEVEKAVTLSVEEAVRGIDGVKEVSSSSNEGGAGVYVELLLGADPDRALADIKAAVDRITSFPEDMERPTVSLIQLRRDVLSLVLYGDASEKALRELAERTRDELLQDPRVSTVEMAGFRSPQINIEVPQDKLRAYGLNLDQIAAVIRAASIEVPAGGVKTDRGEILLRTTERRDFGQQFEQIVVLSRPDGSELRLRDIARVDDGFVDSDIESEFNGKRAGMLKVFRIGDETPLTVSAAVHEYVEKVKDRLPPGVDIAIWADRSEMYEQRIDLLNRNALIGLVLVLLILGLFLEARLAFWVTLGIPISFLGTMLFLPSINASINMISLFAFIVTLGIVVDDAIVVGEAIFKRRTDGMPFLKAAVTGVHDVAQPVIFSVLTTVVAFSPLLFVPGVYGKFYRIIPSVVITVLLLSLVESLLVLPAHLAENKRGGVRRMVALLCVLSGLVLTFAFSADPAVGLSLSALGVGMVLWSYFGDFNEKTPLYGWVHRQQQRFSRAVERFIHGAFVPVLRRLVHRRFLVLAVGVACLIVSCGIPASGRIEFTPMPKIEIDVIFAQLTMPYGTPAEITAGHKERMERMARQVIAESGGDEICRGVYSLVGAATFGGMAQGAVAKGSHIAEVAVFLVPMDQRKINARQFSSKWRKLIGEIPGADSLKFTFSTGAGSGASISIQLSHRDVQVLEAAAAQLAGELKKFNGVKDIDDGVSLGKEQLNFKLKPEARSLGITETDLARQVRAAFWGSEATRQQRGRNELRTYVRLPEHERRSLYDIEELLIRTKNGGEVPLGVAATVDRGRAYTRISRTNGARVITVTADVETGVANADKVVAELRKEAFPKLQRDFPGLTFEMSGQQKMQKEALDALFRGFIVALFVMFALMAIPFKSYLQPLIIMTAIPFGFIGALAGHLIMGFDLSMLSLMGIVALSGVVVNDSIVLISAINGFRHQGMSTVEAVIAGAARRFRPIILTSLTTFFGLAPMIFETSVQARFLIPMALSLGFGVLFATFVILLLVPCLYLALEDIRGLGRRLVRGSSSPEPESGPVSLDGSQPYLTGD